MDFELSDDQRALQEAARDLLDKQSGPERVRQVMVATEPYDTGLWRAMVDQGWLGVDVPEAAGGLGLGFVELAVLLEEVGRHVAPAPIAESALALSALAGTEWAEPLLNGETVGCVRWGEGPTIYAPAADVVVVVEPDRVWAAPIRSDSRPAAEPAMDQTRRLGWLDPGTLPDRVDVGGPDAATALLDRGAVVYSASLLGGAARVLELAADYAKDRVQFGKPIGSFQAVKHRCADMVVDVEGMRSAVYWAAWCIGAGHDDASIAASTAKTWCADAAKRVMASGLQVHGGIGFTWEHDLHLFLKRSQLDQVTFGDATFHRDRLAGLLRAKVEAGESVV